MFKSQLPEPRVNENFEYSFVLFGEVFCLYRLSFRLELTYPTAQNIKIGKHFYAKKIIL